MRTSRRPDAPRLLAASALLLHALVVVAPARAQSDQVPHAVDGIVAIVGGHTPSPTTDVVLRSDVELRAVLALAARTHDPAPAELPPELLAATLQEIVGELVIAREATRLHAPEPTDSQIDRHHEELVRSVGGEERFARLLERHAFAVSEIDAITRRRALVDAFLRANLEGSTLISDARVEETYASGDHPFADRPLDEVREPLRAWLAQTALQRDVRRWVEVLRSRTPVRVVVPFAALFEEDAADRGVEEAEERGDVGSER
ncbi:hypothetical protein [Sandaracinus amylolyticus]|uniref:hypothetical protein n=1 Tax=Sandaracinus amylolyticus TaxID=927083 RepID=UPI001F45297E|nr:hypothetical protein [Sandaracinus amylolyticus]UJR81968.1 Hypothetical protein I5071_40330 [Sandaracinus amylolyticus]